MKFRANTVDLGLSILLALWQVASLPFVHRDWVKAERVSAVVNYLLPTVQLAFGLAAASKARGRSVG